MGAAGAAPGPAVIPGAAGERHARLVEQFERGRRERAVVVPTAPAAVIAQLRALGEPATLFGEAPVDRRGRLRGLLASLDAAGGGAVGVLPGAGEAEAEAEAAAAAAAPAVELFYTEGGEKLQEWRTRLVEFSLARAGHRLGAERARWEGPAAAEEAERFRTGQAAAVEAAGRVALVSSELSGERPASSCAFADDGSFLATCTWAGALQVWRVNGGGAGGGGGGTGLEKPQVAQAHEERCTGVAVRPGASLEGILPGSEPETAGLVTASADCSARVWSLGGQLLHTLEGHTDRLARTEFHPHGGLVATCSFDQTWCLWDLEAGVRVLEQEGHSRAVYAVAFQGDGALAASGGLDGLGRVWDLRTGRCVCLLPGHQSPLLALDFAPNGHLLASGGGDHACRLWDLRKQEGGRCSSLYTLLGHSSLVSQVRFEPGSGAFLLTAGYDGAVALWDATRGSQAARLAGHEGKVMSAALLPGAALVASVGYDRTVKLWAPTPQVSPA